MPPDFDPYAVLGVDPGASLDEIRRAYRARVMQCHPDRGGTPEAMIAVAEAWEVLSDGDARAAVDQARRQRQDVAAQARSDAARQAARTRAESYARAWDSLRQRVSQVAGDFATAEYRPAQAHPGLSFPMAFGSISGRVFSIGGFAVGLAVGIALVVGQQKSFVGQQFLPIGFASAGGWIGSRTHRGLRDAIRRRSRKLLLACRACGRTLRLPDVGVRVEVTCPSCSGKFAHEPDWEAWNKELRESQQVLRKDRKVLAVTLLVVVGVGYFLVRMSINGLTAGYAEGFKQEMENFFDLGYTLGYVDAKRGAEADPAGVRRRLRERAATQPASR
jgi:curved DNA-binding protein CbpA